MINSIQNISDIRINLIKRITGKIYLLNGFFGPNSGTNFEDSMVESISYSEIPNQPYSLLNITVRSTSLLQDIFNVGDTIILSAKMYKPDGRVFYAVVNTFYLGRIQYLKRPLFRRVLHCRDNMLFALTSKHSEQIINTTASKFITRVAERFQFPINFIEETKYVLNNHIFDNSNVHNMWLTALTLEMNQTKIPYRLRMTKDGLLVERVFTNKVGWLFEDDALQDIHYHQGNIYDIVKEISVFNPEFSNVIEKFTPSVQNDTGLSQIHIASELTNRVIDQGSINRYGMFQKRLDITNMDQAESINAGETMLSPVPIEDINLTVPAFFGHRLYDPVYVYHPSTHTATQYFINGFTINMKTGLSNTILNLSKIKEIPKATLSRIAQADGALGLIQDLPAS